MFQTRGVCMGTVSFDEGFPGPLQLQAQRKPGEGQFYWNFLA